jgi:hypothetical protein
VLALGILCAVSTIDGADAAPPPIEAYGRLPAMNMVQLSPSGERYAFIADLDE